MDLTGGRGLGEVLPLPPGPLGLLGRRLVDNGFLEVALFEVGGRRVVEGPLRLVVLGFREVAFLVVFAARTSRCNSWISPSSAVLKCSTESTPPASASSSSTSSTAVQWTMTVPRRAKRRKTREGENEEVNKCAPYFGKSPAYH